MLQSMMRGNATGRPVLFLHAGNFTGRMWLEIAENLPDFYCILPDLPGHGRSAARSLVSLEQSADDLAEMLESGCKSGPVDLVGLSLGGYVGLLLAARHPRLVRRAILSGIHAGAMPHPRLMNVAAALTSPLINFGWFRSKMAGALGSDDTSQLLGEDGRPNVTPATIRMSARLAVEFAGEPLLPDITTPTLAVAGGREHPIILNSLAIFQACMPACVARTAPGLGHGWCAQDPALFAETTRAWILEQPLPEALQPISG